MDSTTPINLPAPIPALEYKSRRKGLFAMGVLLLFLASGLVLMGCLIVLGQVMAQRAGVPTFPTAVIMPVLFYLASAVAFTWLGIGSMLYRRWARALILILSWVWLCFGIQSVAMMAWFLPKAMVTVAPPPPGNVMTYMFTAMMIFMGLFFVIVPGGFVLFYRSPHVRRTCEDLDPVTRWTDACPLPVLAAACLLALAAGMVILYTLSGLSVFPLFGSLAVGLPAKLLLCATACLWGWLASGWYRLQTKAWWILMISLILLSASNFVTFSKVGVDELYEKMGYPQETIALIKSQGLATKTFMTWGMLAWIVPVLGYLGWTKRFFGSKQEAAPMAPQGPLN